MFFSKVQYNYYQGTSSTVVEHVARRRAVHVVCRVEYRNVEMN